MAMACGMVDFENVYPAMPNCKLVTDSAANGSGPAAFDIKGAVPAAAAPMAARFKNDLLFDIRRDWMEEY